MLSPKVSPLPDPDKVQTLFFVASVHQVPVVQRIFAVTTVPQLSCIVTAPVPHALADADSTFDGPAVTEVAKPNQVPITVHA
jgi:hypothetical protein